MIWVLVIFIILFINASSWFQFNWSSILTSFLEIAGTIILRVHVLIGSDVLNLTIKWPLTSNV